MNTPVPLRTDSGICLATELARRRSSIRSGSLPQAQGHDKLFPTGADEPVAEETVAASLVAESSVAESTVSAESTVRSRIDGTTPRREGDDEGVRPLGVEVSAK